MDSLNNLSLLFPHTEFLTVQNIDCSDFPWTLKVVEQNLEDIAIQIVVLEDQFVDGLVCSQLLQQKL